MVLVNTTADIITHGDFHFHPGIPVMVFRNADFYGDEYVLAPVQHDLFEGKLVGKDVNMVDLSMDDAIQLTTQLSGEVRATRATPSFSFAFSWNRASCVAMLDGMQKQIDTFDFDAPEVTVPRMVVMEKSLMVVTMLNAGFLGDALDAFDNVQPDTSNDFLSPYRVGVFQALFDSALKESE